MLKSFLIPMCFWIAKKANNKKPYFVGLAGGQGTGKTTTSSIIKIILEKYFNTMNIIYEKFFDIIDENIHTISKKDIEDIQILEIAQRALPAGNARDWHYALMDYGAWLKANPPAGGLKAMATCPVRNRLSQMTAVSNRVSPFSPQLIQNWDFCCITLLCDNMCKQWQQ